MSYKITKPIESVTINYEDKSRDKMEYYALVGWSKDTWYKIIYSPPKTAAKIEMNNRLVELSDALLKTINK